MNDRSLWEFRKCGKIYIFCLLFISLLVGCRPQGEDNPVASTTSITSTQAHQTNTLPQPSSSLPPDGGSFADVSSRLDLNGELLIYWNPTRALSHARTFLQDRLEFLDGLTENPEADFDAIKQAVDFGLDLLHATGMSSIDAIGFSSKSLGDHIQREKFAMHRHPGNLTEAGNNPHPIWTLLGQPLPMSQHFADFPKSTVVALSGQLDISGLWPVADNTIMRHGNPSMIQHWQEFKNNLNQDSRFSQVLKSFSGRFQWAILVDELNKIPVPSPSGGFEVPEPSLALALEVADESLIEWMEDSMDASGKEGIEIENGRGFSWRLPVPLPIAIAPTFIHQGTRFVIASNQATALAMLTTNRDPNHLLNSTEEVQDWIKKFDNRPVNSITFISSRLGEIVHASLQKAFESMDEIPQSLAFLMRDDWAHQTFMGVSEIDKSGFYSETYTTPIVSQTTLVAPAAIFSAMVIPAFSKAKAKAQEIKCRHNLELLSQAIQVYRLDHQGAFPDKMESLDRNILTPKAFLCPADRNISGSLDSVTWESLQSDIPASYIFNFPQSPSGTNDLLNPPLIVCPFHPHHVLTNGTFQK